jgi:hypothetical protein
LIFGMTPSITLLGVFINESPSRWCFWPRYEVERALDVAGN